MGPLFNHRHRFGWGGMSPISRFQLATIVFGNTQEVAQYLRGRSRQ